MRKLLSVLILLFISIIFASFCYAETIRGKVRVIDGDTVQIRDEKIRLACIDTPESNYRGKVQYCLDNETNCGFLAKKFLWEMIDNKIIVCDFEKRDIYGRIIGVCRDDTWNYEPEDYKDTYNYKIIEEGYAWYYNSGKYCKPFKEKFEEVQRHGIGLFDGWLGGFKEPKLWRKTRSND